MLGEKLMLEQGNTRKVYIAEIEMNQDNYVDRPRPQQ